MKICKLVEPCIFWSLYPLWMGAITQRYDINTNLKNATVTTTPVTSTPATTKTPKAVKVKKEDVKAKEKKVIVIPKTK